MNEFITIKEASQLTGKAEITIRRMIKHLHKQDKAMIRRVKTPQGLQYTINRGFIAKHYAVNNQASSQATNQVSSQKPGASSQDNKALMETLKETITTLQAQLKIKDKQITELMKARERADILHAHAQKQLFMIEHKTEDQVKAEVKTKSNFIQRLFGAK